MEQAKPDELRALYEFFSEHREGSPPFDEIHPSVMGVLKFFRYGHLPGHLQAKSKPFCEMACRIASGAPNAERTVALRKLLEAKDAAVRADL